MLGIIKITKRYIIFSPKSKFQRKSIFEIFVFVFKEVGFCEKYCEKLRGEKGKKCSKSGEKRIKILEYVS